METKKTDGGFSLVELVIVLAIMTILVGVLTPQYIKYVEKARQEHDLAEMDALVTVLTAAYSGEEIPHDVGVVKVFIYPKNSKKKSSCDETLRIPLESSGTNAESLVVKSTKAVWKDGYVAALNTENGDIYISLSSDADSKFDYKSYIFH